jgi:outer membrane receptor for ferrienterochelin and colicins
MNDAALFFSGKLNGFDNFELQPGLRLIKNSRYEAPLITSLNLRVPVQNALTLRASYAKGFRAPSLKELYLDFNDINHNIHGNPNLIAETSDSYNASATFNFDSLKHAINLDLGAFYNNGKDVIVLVNIVENAAGDSINDNEPPPYTNVNIGYRRSKGIRLNMGYNFYPRLTLNAGISYSGVNDFIDLAYKDSTISYNPDTVVYFSNEYSTWSKYKTSFDFNVNLSYNFVKYNTILSVYFKQVGIYHTYDLLNDDYSVQLVPRNVNKYNILDITLAKTFFNYKYKVVIGVKNLFNNITVESSSGFSGGGHTSGGDGGQLIGYGRTYFIKMSYTISKN